MAWSDAARAAAAAARRAHARGHVTAEQASRMTNEQLVAHVTPHNAANAHASATAASATSKTHGLHDSSHIGGPNVGSGKETHFVPRSQTMQSHAFRRALGIKTQR